MNPTLSANQLMKFFVIVLDQIKYFALYEMYLVFGVFLGQKFKMSWHTRLLICYLYLTSWLFLSVNENSHVHIVPMVFMLCALPIFGYARKRSIHVLINILNRVEGSSNMLFLSLLDVFGGSLHEDCHFSLHGFLL